MDILEACLDRQVFASAFRDRTTWNSWFAFLAALFGLPMDAEQQRIFTESVPNVNSHQSNKPRKPGWYAVDAQERASSSLSPRSTSPRSSIGVPISASVNGEP